MRTKQSEQMGDETLSKKYFFDKFAAKLTKTTAIPHTPRPRHTQTGLHNFASS